MSYPYILSFKHYFEDDNNFYLLIEPISQNLYDIVQKQKKTFNEIEIQPYIIKIIGALKYLHSKRIIHRDIKLGNIFLIRIMKLRLENFLCRFN